MAWRLIQHFVEVGTDDEIFVVQSDYQGWTNWETWNTSLMMDNEQELYNQVRELAEKYKGRPRQERKL